MALKDHPVRDHLVGFIGEFVGTFLFLFFAFAGAQTASLPLGQPDVPTGQDTSKLMYISLVFGFSLAVNVWIFFRVSGGLFNPAATLALALVGATTPFRAVLAGIAQVLGGMFASIIVKVLLPGDEVLFAVKLGPGTTVVQGFFIEMLLTLLLVFAILMLAAEKTKATFIAPIGIGLALFVGHLVGVYWTGAGINPARAFGPAVASLTFPGYHWLYWLGPFLGSIIATALYKILKLLDYEAVNGHQDKAEDDNVTVDIQADTLKSVLTDLLPARPRSWLQAGKDASRPRSWVRKDRDVPMTVVHPPYTSSQGLRHQGTSSIDCLKPTHHEYVYDAGQYETQVGMNLGVPPTSKVLRPDTAERNTSQQMPREF